MFYSILFVIRQNYNFNGSKYDKKARKIIFHAFLLYDTYYINRKRILISSESVLM